MGDAEAALTGFGGSAECWARLTGFFSRNHEHIVKAE
jgi:hypothetical protein